MIDTNTHLAAIFSGGVPSQLLQQLYIS